ncbi:hypothetical protein CYMTET_23520, partial [Cymbomonas tetramitiformis]
APTHGFARHVGMKTTFRMLNRLWTAHYASGRFIEMGLPMEKGLTLIISRTDGHQFEKLYRTIKAYRPDVNILYLSSRVVSAARRLLVAYRVKLCKAGFGPYSGGSTPSSGYVAIYLLMHMCQTLTVYGFGRTKLMGQGSYLPYHYYTGVGSRQAGDPVHSFSSEDALISELARENYLSMCSLREVNGSCHTSSCSAGAIHRHNKMCGFNQFSTMAAYQDAFRKAGMPYKESEFLDAARKQEKVRYEVSAAAYAKYILSKEKNLTRYEKLKQKYSSSKERAR